MQAIQDSSFIAIARFSGVFGVKGWLKIHAYTSPRIGIFQYRPWWISVEDNLPEAIEHTGGKQQGKYLVVKLDAVHDRDMAQAWIGRDIYIKRSQLPELSEAEYYWVDLIGMSVETIDGYQLGKISYLFETGSNDVMVVTDAEDNERLVPWIMDQVVHSVDKDNGVVQVDWNPDF